MNTSSLGDFAVSIASEFLFKCVFRSFHFHAEYTKEQKDLLEKLEIIRYSHKWARIGMI